MCVCAMAMRSFLGSFEWAGSGRVRTDDVWSVPLRDGRGRQRVGQTVGWSVESSGNDESNL